MQREYTGRLLNRSSLKKQPKVRLEMEGENIEQEQGKESID